MIQALVSAFSCNGGLYPWGLQLLFLRWVAPSELTLVVATKTLYIVEAFFIELCSFDDVILAGYDAQPGLPRQEDFIKLQDDKIVIQRSESFIHLSSCREYYTCSTTRRTPPFLTMGISILLMPIRL